MDDKWISLKLIDLVIDFCKAHDLEPLSGIFRRKEEWYNFNLAHNKWIKTHQRMSLSKESSWRVYMFCRVIQVLVPALTRITCSILIRKPASPTPKGVIEALEMNQVLLCRKYWMGCFTETLWSKDFSKWGPAKWSYISAWTYLNLSSQGHGVTCFREKSSEKRGLGCVSGWHKVCPEEQMQQLTGQSWQREVAQPLPLASLRLRFENAQFRHPWAQIWGGWNCLQKNLWKWGRVRKFVLRCENLLSSLCLAENRRGLSWFCCDLYVTAGCTS